MKDILVQCQRKMLKLYYVQVLLWITIYTSGTNGWNGYPTPNDCGPYGFTCERNNKLRLCDDTKPVGPSFVCPLGTFCNEESTAVCEDAINHLDPTLTKRIRCQRNERITNPNVPGCKGYILCVLNGDRLQAVNFKCSGNTVFNGITRTCTSPSKYKCPLENITKTQTDLYHTNNVKDPPKSSETAGSLGNQSPSSIECKNYKLRVTQDNVPNRATYFCPRQPIRGHDSLRCTIFSNHFCITLDRDTDDQYLIDNIPKRKPRMQNENVK